MKSRAALIAGLFASTMAVTSCNSTPSGPPPTPVGPSSLSEELLPRLDGLWGGYLTLTSVSGGTGSVKNAGAPSCVNSAVDEIIPETVEHRLSITHSGTKLTAKLVSVGNGLACNYEGQVGSANSLILHTTTCTPLTLRIGCAGSPPARMTLAGSSLTATFNDPINPTLIQGTVAHTYNVEVDNGEGSAVVTNHVFTDFVRR